MANEIKYVGNQFQESSEQSTSKTEQTSTQKNVLDAQLMQTILSGLSGQMTESEIRAFAESLLRPQLNAELEASRQQYATTAQALNAQKDDLAVQLARAIAQQQRAYGQSVADVETAALARGMGRSSYTMEALRKQGASLADTIRQLTDETNRQQSQIQQQLTLAAQQAAQTQGRLNTDYASQLAAKTQELMQSQRDSYDSKYMSAVSAAMGSQSTGTQSTTSSGGSVGVSGIIQNDSNHQLGESKPDKNGNKGGGLILYK